MEELKKGLSKLSKKELTEIIAFARELKKTAKATSTLNAEARKAFIKFYSDTFKIGYYWTGVDAHHLKLMLAKIEAKLKFAKIEINDENMLSSFKLFIEKVYKLNDAWINDHFTVAIINSQFNAIYLRFKHNLNGTKISDDYKARVINDLR